MKTFNPTKATIISVVMEVVRDNASQISEDLMVEVCQDYQGFWIIRLVEPGERFGYCGFSQNETPLYADILVAAKAAVASLII